MHKEICPATLSYIPILIDKQRPIVISIMRFMIFIRLHLFIYIASNFYVLSNPYFP